MFKVIVEQECGCFKKSSLENGIEMDAKDGALLKSLHVELVYLSIR